MNGIGALFARLSAPHERLFLKREYAAIRGTRGQVSRLLLAMVLATLLAVVLARSGMEHLKRRMADPFTSMLSITAGSGAYSGNYERIRSFLDSCAMHGAFDASKASGGYSEGWHFYTTKNKGDEYTSIISFDRWKDRDLLERILRTDNLVRDLADVEHVGPDAYRDGIIISKEFLETLGCELNELRSKRIIMVHGDYAVLLRVLAVVHTLPERSRCLVDHSLLMDIRDRNALNVFPTREYKELEIYVDAAVSEETDALENTLSQFIHEAVHAHVIEVNDLATHTRMLVVERTNGQTWSTEDKSYWQKQLCALRSPIRHLRPAVRFEARLQGPDSTRIFGKSEPVWYAFDHLTITFHDLDSIGEFQRAIETETGRGEHRPVELDLDRVESQKNFAVVSTLGYFLLATLVLFAMLSILLYIYNLLRNHLNRMKMNLGTFMAFGLSPEFIQAGYLRIIVLLLLRVCASAVAILVSLQVIAWLMARSGVATPQAFDHVSVLGNPWMYVCLASILTSSVLICRWQLRSFLEAPPGDLIYDRK